MMCFYMCRKQARWSMSWLTWGRRRRTLPAPSPFMPWSILRTSLSMLSRYVDQPPLSFGVSETNAFFLQVAITTATSSATGYYLLPSEDYSGSTISTDPDEVCVADLRPYSIVSSSLGLWTRLSDFHHTGCIMSPVRRSWVCMVHKTSQTQGSTQWYNGCGLECD